MKTSQAPGDFGLRPKPVPLLLRWLAALDEHHLAIVAVVWGVSFLAYGLAGLVSMDRLRELGWLETLPEADAAHPTSGPARYAGKLRGPPGRTTPSGRPAAAYWWAVVSEGEEGDSVQCSGRERTALVLETPSGELLIPWADAAVDDAALITDEQHHEYGRPFTFDLGPVQAQHLAQAPAGLCWAPFAGFKQHVIVPGARVEVMGCVRNGKLAACNHPISGILAVDSLAHDRRHRVDAVVEQFRTAFWVSVTVLVLFGLALVAFTRDSIRTFRRGGT